MGNKPGGRNKTQQPIQSLLEDAISALQEKPGSTLSDIIKYLESKYDKSISIKMKEKLLDRLKPILKASRMDYNNKGSLQGASRGGGKGGGGGSGGGGRMGRGTRSGANSMKRKLGGMGIGKQGGGGQGAGSSHGSGRRRNNNGSSNRVINSSHGGGRSSTKLALSRCKTKSKQTRGRGRPSAHFSKLESSNISPHIDINGDHYDNDYEPTGCRSDLDGAV